MIQPGFVAVKLVALVLSLVVAYLAYHGYTRSGNEAMLYVAVGFILIGVGAVCEGVVYRVFDTTLVSAAAVQAVIFSSGMLFVLVSLTRQGNEGAS
ncbi:hypothetical protein EGH25_10200 [Haladaptatus sp. F3-133]|uniref:Uncharacterized protein n=1 Tax=Halorutilus salinus TaxID=2487751 RepID=A0A9Q4C5N6_9EURY|nr:hypothetical protein [Halorutilus salinus]MCX2819718.1 hypothetical protein [Halorutilus salinus]